jgi:anaerobic selenocysteine-containing dehydrogenase
MTRMATMETRRTACSLDCFDACGIVAEVQDGRIVRIGGDPAHPITRGALRVRLECDDGLRTDSVFVPKGEWAKHERGLNVLTEPRFTAGTGTAYNQNYVRLERG